MNRQAWICLPSGLLVNCLIQSFTLLDKHSLGACGIQRTGQIVSDDADPSLQYS